MDNVNVRCLVLHSCHSLNLMLNAIIFKDTKAHHIKIKHIHRQNAGITSDAVTEKCESCTYQGIFVAFQKSHAGMCHLFVLLICMVVVVVMMMLLAHCFYECHIVVSVPLFRSQFQTMYAIVISSNVLKPFKAI